MGWAACGDADVLDARVDLFGVARDPSRARPLPAAMTAWAAASRATGTR